MEVIGRTPLPRSSQSNCRRNTDVEVGAKLTPMTTVDRVAGRFLGRDLEFLSFFVDDFCDPFANQL